MSYQGGPVGCADNPDDTPRKFPLVAARKVGRMLMTVSSTPSIAKDMLALGLVLALWIVQGTPDKKARRHLSCPVGHLFALHTSTQYFQC